MRLQARFLASLAPAAAVSGALLILLTRRTTDAVLLDERAQQALALAPELSARAEAGVRDRSEAEILPLLQSARARTDAAYAVAVDASGSVLAHTNVVEKGRVYRDPLTQRALRVEKPEARAARVLGRELLDVAIPVWSAEEDPILAREKGGRRRLGALRLGLPLDDVRKTGARIFGRMAAILLGTGALMAALIALLLRRVLRPVQLLAESAAKVGRGQLGVTVDLRSDDELGALARSFNRMSEGLDRILHSVVDIVVVADARGRIQTVNRAALELLGYAEADLVGQPLGLVLELDASELAARLSRGLVKDFESHALAKTGRRIPALVSASPLLDEGRAIEGVIVVAKDLSERRVLETKLAQSERLSAIGRLAGGVAHDFNNILTAISGYSELVLGALDPADGNRGDVAEIKKAAERAAGLTRQLLAFSRKQILQPSVMDLNAMIAGMERMLRRLISEDIGMSLALAPGLWRVKADAGQMEQVLLNLVVNARDAMPRGGRLAMETSNLELKAPLTHRHGQVPPGEYAVVAVGDSGHGMTPDVQAHLFEPFFTTKERGKGTGLGLATVHGIVAQSGGFIGVESEAGRGTTFRVYLPRCAAEAAPREPASTAPAPRGREMILLVEDDPGPREVARRTLLQAGYRVLAAGSPAEALELRRACADRVALLLTDVVLPGMDGPELARRLLAASPGLKVLYMSGYTDHPLLRAGGDADGPPLLQKPFTLHELTSKVRAALDGGGGGSPAS